MNASNFSNQTLSITLYEYKVVTIFKVIVIPIICVYGVLSNLVCLFSLVKAHIQDHMYKYMVAKSAINVLYTFLCGFIFVFKCGNMCLFSSTSIIVVLYEYLIWDYFTSCLAILNILIEIIMCLQRCSIVYNWTCFRFERFYVVILVLSSISLLPYIPSLFLREVISSVNNEYKIVETKIGLSTTGYVLKLCMAFLRGAVPLLSFVIINIFTAIKFLQLIRNKNKLRFNTKKYEQSGHKL